ncbi:MAG: DUF4185 domain-containing protein [Terracidiphilus sp.]
MRSLGRSLVATGLTLATGACAPPALVLSSNGPPGLTVVQATDLGAIPTNPEILGRDGGYSALFDGNSVWLYGDTFLTKPNAQDFTLISDSWSYTTDLNAQGGITGFKEPTDQSGAPKMILPETAAEQAFNNAHNANNCRAQPCGARWALWPMSITVDPAANQALIFYQVVSALPGNFNFQGIGESAATWQSLNAVPVRPNLNPPIVSGHPDLLFGVSDPSFGSASLIANGKLYVYGCGVANNGFDKGCRLAKVDPAQAQNRSAWSFYTGSGNWSPQDSNAVPVFEGDSILSVDWNSYLGLYVAVYSAPFSQNVMIRTAKAPEGPWSRETVAFVAMQPASGNVYDAHAHAEYDLNGGQTIFVSYSRGLPAPFTSEVRLVEVQLKANTAH